MYIKENYRKHKIGSFLFKALVKVSKKLKIEYTEIQASNIGRYAWLKMGDRVKFLTKEQQKEVFNNWENVKSKYPAKLKINSKPKDYPKEFLISKDAPEFIWYKIYF